MNRPRGEHHRPPERAIGEHAPRPASGIVRKGDFDAELAGGTPSWAVVNAYLSHGEHRAWVEGHAARSPAFAEVLAALRSDHQERLADRRGALYPFG